MGPNRFGLPPMGASASCAFHRVCGNQVVPSQQADLRHVAQNAGSLHVRRFESWLTRMPGATRHCLRPSRSDGSLLPASWSGSWIGQTIGSSSIRERDLVCCFAGYWRSVALLMISGTCMRSRLLGTWLAYATRAPCTMAFVSMRSWSGVPGLPTTSPHSD